MNKPLRRPSTAWCPGCSQEVPEGHMKVNEGGRYVWLERCKACQSSTRIANERALVAARHDRSA